MLEIDRLTLKFGGLTAVNDVTLKVREGEIFSVIGPNGAGKTSLFNAITGIYRPSAGRILLRGRDVRLALSGRVLGQAAIAGIVTGIGAVCSISIQSLWTRVVTENYVYQQPFSFIDALRDGSSFFADLPFSWGCLPFILGGLIGVLGSFSIWHRSRYSPTIAASRGISRTFQNIRLFQSMTVLENVMVGLEQRLSCSVVESALRLPRHFREERRAAAEAKDWLSFVGLREKSDKYASSLPYGHQRRLEIARALASRPAIILLDEPAAGMNPAESSELMELIRKIRDSGVTVVLIEHHMQVVMGISDRIVVLDYGNKIAEGTPEEIKKNPRVIEAYLGKEPESTHASTS